MTLLERIWLRVDKQGPIPAQCPNLGPCWVGSGANIHGYPVINVDGKTEYIFHILYSMDGGVVPPDKERDHLCRNRACVNPSHIEVVTSGVNVLRGNAPPAKNARKTHCAKGHVLSGENLTPYALRQGLRQCWICAKENDKLRAQADRAARKAQRAKTFVVS